MLPDELLMRSLRWEDARDLGGDTFEVFPDDDGAEALPMTVVYARERNSTPGMIQYALLLRGPGAPFLAQRTYRFRHARLGEFAFLITAVARTGDALDYEACFSHAP
jgi:Domain of unknown function (DUF6916)